MIYMIMFLGAVISAVVAMGKNRNVIGYAALGAFFPLFGVIVVCCLPAAATSSGAMVPATSNEQH